jgi:hypothetical protein
MMTGDGDRPPSVGLLHTLLRGVVAISHNIALCVFRRVVLSSCLIIFFSFIYIF